MDQGDVERLIRQIQSSQPMNSQLLDGFITAVAERTVDVKLVEKWLKAVHSTGISVEETTRLTKGMMFTGDIIKWSDNSLVVDKHSTGGVGDKMSLMLAPILAACGLKVPMLAGRGLGHTGGTIDKLESIPGFNCSLTPHEMRLQVDDIGCCIAAQNDAIAPADGLLYAIRDVTDTIDSIPLITASIISKKAAEGLGSLVLDVKCGAAAFMKTEKDAKELAYSMVGAAQGLGIDTVAQITAMDYPIGAYIGNSLEVLGSIQVLQGKGSRDTVQLVKLQCVELLKRSKLAASDSIAKEMIDQAINSGAALDKFRQMCVKQGVDQDVAKTLTEYPELILPSSQQVSDIVALESGFVSGIDAMSLAEIARQHGAGRFTIEDEIIPEIGFTICVEHGRYISEGETWLKFHHNRDLSDETRLKLANSLSLSSMEPDSMNRLISTID